MKDIFKEVQLNNGELQDISPEELVVQLRESAELHRHKAKEMRKIFLLTGIVVLSLAVVFFGIMAWFVNNKSVTGTGISVNTIDQKTEIADYDVYYCIKNADGTVKTYDRKTFNQAIAMPDYDAVLGIDNSNTSVILRIPITRTAAFSSSTQNINVSIGRADAATWHTVSTTGANHYMSSVLQLKCAPISALQGESDEVAYTENETIYKAAVAEFDKTSSGSLVHPASTFIDKDNPKDDNYQKSVSFTVSDGYKVYNTADGKYKTYIYVQYDYCDELIKKFFEITDGLGSVGYNDYISEFFYDASSIAVSITDK